MYSERKKRERRLRQQRDPRRHFVKTLVQRLASRCNRRGMPFDLVAEDIAIPKRCPVLGIKLKFTAGTGKRQDHTPSIDRIDNRLGYLKSNVIIISWRANRLKSDATPEELRRLAEYYG